MQLCRMKMHAQAWFASSNTHVGSTCGTHTACKQPHDAYSNCWNCENALACVQLVNVSQLCEGSICLASNKMDFKQHALCCSGKCKPCMLLDGPKRHRDTPKPTISSSCRLGQLQTMLGPKGTQSNSPTIVKHTRIRRSIHGGLAAATIELMQGTWPLRSA